MAQVITAVGLAAITQSIGVTAKVYTLRYTISSTVFRLLRGPFEDDDRSPLL